MLIKFTFSSLTDIAVLTPINDRPEQVKLRNKKNSVQIELVYISRTSDDIRWKFIEFVT